MSSKRYTEEFWLAAEIGNELATLDNPVAVG